MTGTKRRVENQNLWENDSAVWKDNLRNREAALNSWKIPEPFVLAYIEGGTERDRRKRVFYQYVGWLIELGKSLKEIEEEVLAWNMRNRPPLRKSWIRSRLNWCWFTWRRDREIGSKKRES